MFNQKINHFTSKNPNYVNYSVSAPNVNPEVIHNCGTTINKYTKSQNCGSLPLQTWCSKNVAVESFAMRPIVNSKEYFENIKKYLQSVVLADYQELKKSLLTNEHYILYNDYGREPENSLLQTINLEVANVINFVMAQSAEGVNIFKNYNPICEGFIVTDITINTYKSSSNDNHYFHQIFFSAVNTTRYNTVSFKATLYQDTTPMMNNWNKAINEVTKSLNVTKDINDVNSIVYIATLELLNNTTCVVGQEDDCQFKGYNLNGKFSQLLNNNLLQAPKDIAWLQPNTFADNTYDYHGNYDESGQIRIVDRLGNIEKLIKELGY